MNDSAPYEIWIYSIHFKFLTGDVYYSHLKASDRRGIISSANIKSGFALSKREVAVLKHEIILLLWCFLSAGVTRCGDFWLMDSNIIVFNFNLSETEGGFWR